MIGRDFLSKLPILKLEQNGLGVPGKEQRIEIPCLFSSLRPVWIVLLDEIAAKKMKKKKKKKKKPFFFFFFRLYAIHPHGRLPKPPFQIFFEKRQKGRVSLSLWITVFFCLCCELIEHSIQTSSFFRA